VIFSSTHQFEGIPTTCKIISTTYTRPPRTLPPQSHQPSQHACYILHLLLLLHRHPIDKQRRHPTPPRLLSRMDHDRQLRLPRKPLHPQRRIRVSVPPAQPPLPPVHPPPFLFAPPDALPPPALPPSTVTPSPPPPAPQSSTSYPTTTSTSSSTSPTSTTSPPPLAAN